MVYTRQPEGAAWDMIGSVDLGLNGRIDQITVFNRNSSSEAAAGIGKAIFTAVATGEGSGITKITADRSGDANSPFYSVTLEFKDRAVSILVFKCGSEECTQVSTQYRNSPSSQ